jgi:hypothetical protein
MQNILNTSKKLDIKYILGALLVLFISFIIFQIYKSIPSYPSAYSNPSAYPNQSSQSSTEYFFQRGGADTTRDKTNNSVTDEFGNIAQIEVTDPIKEGERLKLARQGLGALTTPGVLSQVDTAGRGAVTGQYETGSTPISTKPGLQAGIKVDPLTGLFSTEAARNTRNPFALFASGPDRKPNPDTVDPGLGGLGPEGINKGASPNPNGANPNGKPRDIYQDLAPKPDRPKYRYGFDDIDLINDKALPGVKKFCQKWGVTPDQLTDEQIEQGPNPDGGLVVGPDGVPVRVEPRPGGKPTSPPNGADSCERIVTVPEKVGCVTDNDCNIVFGNGNNKCLSGKCRCNSGTGTFCHLRSDYYKKLSEMTPAQIIKFKKHGKLEKMTIKDYLKWLSLFKYDIENLPKQHLGNFNRYLKGLPIYDIPLSDPTDEFFASSAAKNDRVCLTIPNAEVDSPLNWKMRSDLDSSGMINVLEETQRPLNYSRFYGHRALSNNRMERTNDLTAKDWFFNNINWMFNDVDRTNSLYANPQANRFMNIIDQTNAERIQSGQVRPGATAQRLATQSSGLLPTNEEGTITPANNISSYGSGFEAKAVDIKTGIAESASSFLDKFRGDK